MSSDELLNVWQRYAPPDFTVQEVEIDANQLTIDKPVEVKFTVIFTDKVGRKMLLKIEGIMRPLCIHSELLN